MSPPADPSPVNDTSPGAGGQSMEDLSNPKVDGADAQNSSPPSTSVSPKSVTWSSDLIQESQPQSLPTRGITGQETTSMPADTNTYVTSTQTFSSSKNAVESVKDVLGRWGRKLGEAAKNTEDLAGNFWQHLKTGPSFADAAMARIAQGSKVIAEGGYEKIFQLTFDTFPEEQLRKTYACYLSTSAGPVMGSLYLSTAKLAFCSDNPLSYTIEDKTEWSYYKVVIPLHQLRSVNPSTSKANPAEKYMQVVSVDNHEFWFMGFLNYENAVNHIQEAAFNAPDPNFVLSDV